MHITIHKWQKQYAIAYDGEDEEETDHLVTLFCQVDLGPW